MLEHVPQWLGAALMPVRAGAEKLAIAQRGIGHGIAALDLSSPAFAAGETMPMRFTADGIGVSPPLVWAAVPLGTASLALIVEDADSPTPAPLVHAIVWALPPTAGFLSEGALSDGAVGTDGAIGRNSYLAQGWLPPDPPTGHGAHRYVFQLFALAPLAGASDGAPGRAALLRALAGQVLAAGLLIGRYERAGKAD